MIISHSRKFIFIHVHKTAGESVTNALAPFLARGDLVLGSTALGELLNVYYRRRHRLTKHSTAAVVKAFVGPDVWDAYFKFAIVRHPCDRVRSLYFYFARMAERRKSASPRNLLYHMPMLAARDPLLWPGISAYLATQTFSDFIRHPDFRADIAARPQHVVLGDPAGVPMTDFVGRLETLEADFRSITERIGLPAARLGWHNPSDNSLRAGAPLSAEDRALLQSIYAEDFRRFGYPLAA